MGALKKRRFSFSHLTQGHQQTLQSELMALFLSPLKSCQAKYPLFYRRFFTA